MHKLIEIIILLTIVGLSACANQETQLSESENAILKKIKFDRNIAIELKKQIKSSFEESRSEINIFNPTTKKIDFDTKINDGITFSMDENEVEKIISKNYLKYKDRGYYIFRSEMNFGNTKDKITILKANNQFDILRAMRTDGINYDLDNEAVINKLISWNDKYNFHIIGAGLDWVDARFDKKPMDMKIFAKEVYDFCPDIVDQGTNTVEALAEEMDKNNTLYLWWD